jgi:hypothetical protein
MNFDHTFQTKPANETIAEQMLITKAQSATVILAPSIDNRVPAVQAVAKGYSPLRSGAGIDPPSGF